ncbi:hypothetical protein GCM10023324_19890 [Streptomyces youssoufiensis]
MVVPPAPVVAEQAGRIVAAAQGGVDSGGDLVGGELVAPRLGVRNPYTPTFITTGSASPSTTICSLSSLGKRAGRLVGLRQLFRFGLSLGMLGGWTHMK